MDVSCNNVGAFYPSYIKDSMNVLKLVDENIYK